uniref:Uncharacterized protein n=1 Tax=Arundo donax TaxID=35708 RepID=A0A0A9GQY2_ARUDO
MFIRTVNPVSYVLCRLIVRHHWCGAIFFSSLAINVVDRIGSYSLLSLVY